MGLTPSGIDCSSGVMLEKRFVTGVDIKNRGFSMFLASEMFFLGACRNNWEERFCQSRTHMNTKVYRSRSYYVAEAH